MLQGDAFHLLKSMRWKYEPLFAADNTLIPAIRTSDPRFTQEIWLASGLIMDPNNNLGVLHFTDKDGVTWHSIAGRKNLQTLRFYGLNFPGSSDFISPELN